MDNKILTITFLIVSLILFGCTKDEKSEKVRKTEFLMGTVVEVILYGDENELNKDKTDKVFKEVFNEIKSIENNFTAGMIRGGEHVYLDEEGMHLLEKSMYFSEITQGTFDITVGPLTKLWNISPGEKNKIPQKEEIERCVSLIDYNKIKTICPGMIHIENEEMFADFGAIAKGYAADRAAIILKNNEINTAILNLGGNVYAIGEKVWKFGIQDPFMKRGDFLGIVSLKNQSLVTSGIYERYFEEKGKIYHHIFDTKTGYPVENELLSVSVISDKSLDGDALSTAAFALGLDKGIKLLEDYEGAEGVFVTKNNEIFLTSGISEQEFQLVKRGKYEIKKR
jgi:thiamine biosynthesis lipoprotein